MATKLVHSKETYLEWYRIMTLIRHFEMKSAQMYGMQKIRGFCHLYNGQEAVVAGMVSAIKKGDKVITAYRDHGHALALGMHPNQVMAELFGKSTGSSKGKGGSMHMFDKEKGMYGGHGIVGAQIPLGAGMAFAEKYNGTDNISLCFFGDGAARQGALHEAFNMAMTWKLPVLFICENNEYAMGTSVERTSNVTDLYKLGCAYEMPSEPVDGMSCEAVHDAISKAAKHIRSGKGPYYLEMKTYRYRGHSMSDPAKYRKEGELDSFTAKDPMHIIEKTMLKNKFATQKQIEAIEQEQIKIVEESVEFAENSPLPNDSEIYEDVYVGDYPYIVE